VFRHFAVSVAVAIFLTACSHATSSNPLPNGASAQRIAPASGSSFKSLFSFNGTNGALPSGVVALGRQLYGTTGEFGASGCDYQGKGCGVIYELSFAGRERTLHRFDARANGSSPNEPLTYVPNLFYGTTSYGGSHGAGTIFEMTPAGKVTVLYTFKGQPDGAGVFSSLTDVDGVFYGTTLTGGTNNQGTVFSVTTSGKEQVLYSFTGKTDGAFPDASLIAVNGTLYGTAYEGGARGRGDVFSITTTGTFQTVYSFKYGLDGAYPTAGLTAVNGTLYGVTSDGGDPACKRYRCGTVFAINGSKETVLYRFKGGADGEHPGAALTYANGFLYGTAETGGADGAGTIFSLTPSGGESVLYTFTGGSDGAFPDSELTDAGGVLYGTTQQGGTSGKGAVYALTP
jgi:uncharacterized repeat protein (TIGR03803 family)